MPENVVSDRNYEDFANSIIEMAVRDFRWANAALNKKRCSEKTRLRAERLYNDTVRFFRSQWFAELTNLDGEDLLKKLSQEGKKKKKKKVS